MCVAHQKPREPGSELDVHPHLPWHLCTTLASPELALASATRIFWAASQFSSLPAQVLRVEA